MRKVIGCELCGSTAKIHCESDGASLCWTCDGKVHAANFLVGKHIRTLLCHRCQSPSPWTSSGPKLPPSLSFCVSCLDLESSPQIANHQEEVEDDDDGTYTDDHDDQDDDQDDDDDVDDVDDDDENQVVPGTSSSSLEIKAPTSSGDDDEDKDDGHDDDEDEVDNGNLFSSSAPDLLKRKRETTLVHRNTLPRL